MRDPQHSSPVAQTATVHKAQRTGLGCSLLLLALLVGLVATLALLAPRALAMLANQTTTTPSQLTDRTSPEAMIAQRVVAAAQLNAYGWVDQAANVAHIPIARAIALIAEQGLPVGIPAAEVTTEQPITNAAPPAAPAAIEPTQVDFQHDVLPIFEQRCNDCHGFEEPEEGLVLTGYKSVLQGSQNGPVITPGDPDKSYLVELIVKGKMPKRGTKLTLEEIAIITAWVKGGALEKAADPSSGSASAPVTPTQAVTKTVAVKTPVSTPTATVTAIDPTEVDFQRDVLPIFEQRCNDCHGFEEPEEDLVLTGYRSVTQGSKNGPVIAPGDPDKSLLVELIGNGKMPKRGKKLTAEEIAIITAWVEGGALEKAAAGSAGGEVTSPPSAAITATVTSTVTGTPKATPSPVTASVDPATVSFQNDVLPIFEQRCNDCHGFEEPEEGLVLTGYRSVLRGSDQGSIIAPGDPDKSLLVELIVKGKMPKRGKKLTPEEIAIITAWVRGGARDN